MKFSRKKFPEVGKATFEEQSINRRENDLKPLSEGRAEAPSSDRFKPEDLSVALRQRARCS